MKELNDAEQKLNKARHDYHLLVWQLNNRFNAAKQEVNSIENERRHWEGIRNNLHKLNPQRAWYLTKIEACNVRIAAANAALEVAQLALNGIVNNAVTIAFNTAETALAAVRNGGNAIAFQNAEKYFNELNRGIQQFDPFRKAQEALKSLESGNQKQAWQAAENTYNEVLKLGQAAVNKAKKN